MKNQISFMSANFVARQLNYQMTEGWAQGDRATNAYFQPIDTFAQRFAALLAEIQTMGFTALDLWLPHLNPHWATTEHIATAQELLAQHGLTVTSLAGGFGATRTEVEASCRLAQALGTTILGGNSGLLATDRALLVAILHDHGVRLGIENHPEKTPQELLAKIGDSGDGVIGACVDTGWFGTHGFDAAFALVELRNHLVHIHLKDVLAAGGHESCRYGRGVVPIRLCLDTLDRIGYTGPISVEHEPEHGDPTEDCKANLRMVRRWLSRS
jgi:L-ribulose-5-phosphate 3-epimerase